MATKDFLKTATALLDSVRETKMDMAEVDVPACAANHALQSVAMDSAEAVQTWVEDSDMDEGEGEADRFMAMLVGIADADKNGELSEDESDLIQVSANAAWDYMASKGASEEDLDAMFNGEDQAASNAAAARIKALIVDSLPDGDESASNDVDDFAFGNSQESVFDAVYKKKFAIRGGRKVVVRKRISGVVRLSAKQKMAVRKMHMKSNNAKARLGRMKSMRVAKSMGMGR